MVESSGEHEPRWYDDLEPRRHMIAERKARSQKRVKVNCHIRTGWPYWNGGGGGSE